METNSIIEGFLSRLREATETGEVRWRTTNAVTGWDGLYRRECFSAKFEGIQLVLGGNRDHPFNEPDDKALYANGEFLDRSIAWDLYQVIQNKVRARQEDKIAEMLVAAKQRTEHGRPSSWKVLKAALSRLWRTS